jgi:hypothetical protein
MLRSRQGKADKYSTCNRPYCCPTALPLTRLLYPTVFGEDVDNAENYVLTPDDVQFCLEFVQDMVNTYNVTGGRSHYLFMLRSLGSTERLGISSL